MRWGICVWLVVVCGGNENAPECSEAFLLSMGSEDYMKVISNDPAFGPALKTNTKAAKSVAVTVVINSCPLKRMRSGFGGTGAFEDCEP